MHIWLQDVRYAVRMLRKNAALTVVIVASLANLHSTCMIEEPALRKPKRIFQ